MSIAFAREEPPGSRPAERHRPEDADQGTDAAITDIGQAGRAKAPTPVRRVLIAEDHQGMRATLAEIMKTEGYQVMEARDGQAALGVLSDSPVDVLILDLAMPRVDGLELLGQITATPPPVVIIYSAFEYYTPAEVEQQVGSRIFRSLRKPIAPARLVAAVADACNELERLDDEPD